LITAGKRVKSKRLYFFHLHPGQATGQEAQFAGGVFGKVNNAFIIAVQAVCYLHNYRAAIAEVGHFYIRAQGEGIMGSRHTTIVKNFAIGGCAAIELICIEAGSPMSGFVAILFPCTQKDRVQQETAAEAYNHQSDPLYYLPVHGRKITKTMPESLRIQPLFN
jgi:hypothetical protein